MVGVVGLGFLVATLQRRTQQKNARANQGVTYQRYSPVPSRVNLSDSKTSFPTQFALWVFTAKTCRTCPGAIRVAKQFETNSVSVLEFTYEKDKDIHNLYGIDSVPLTLIIKKADEKIGEVKKWFFGPLSKAELDDELDVKN